ncbi:PleD family two-component system response regulator [Marimonas sp. MJW-29]|uniref:PleD family two-component system response regulator n=1 Tax=Sulfitobacter sediminis TaxID=3234186 RepID=A0ABV3RQU8_9RHOB
MRLLAVDDDPLILDLLPIVFRQANLPQITVASSGPDALEMLSDPETEVDGLILDIEMPEMTGIELCRKIRAMPRYRHTPILMLTSVSDSTRIERAFAAGADDYITKPFDVKEIATRVRVAERMTEKSVNAPVLDPEQRSENAVEGRHHFDITEPVRLVGAEKLILPFALGNYLSQLSRRYLDDCSIFALRITDIDHVFASCKTHEYARALAGMVSAVNRVVACPNLLMAYEGDGMFLCITQGKEPPAWPEIEDMILEALSEENICFDDGHPIRIDIAVGNPVTPNASRNQRVKKTFDRAKDRAFNREKIKNRQHGKSAKAGGPGKFLS